MDIYEYLTRFRGEVVNVGFLKREDEHFNYVLKKGQLYVRDGRIIVGDEDVQVLGPDSALISILGKKNRGDFLINHSNFGHFGGIGYDNQNLPKRTIYDVDVYEGAKLGQLFDVLLEEEKYVPPKDPNSHYNFREFPY